MTCPRRVATVTINLAFIDHRRLIRLGAIGYYRASAGLADGIQGITSYVGFFSPLSQQEFPEFVFLPMTSQPNRLHTTIVRHWLELPVGHIQRHNAHTYFAAANVMKGLCFDITTSGYTIKLSVACDRAGYYRTILDYRLNGLLYLIVYTAIMPTVDQYRSLASSDD